VPFIVPQQEIDKAVAQPTQAIEKDDGGRIHGDVLA
jgi:hypothetical protein